MNKIEFNNLVEEDIEEVDLLEKVLLYAMDKEGLVDTSFDVIFVDNSYIHNLNKLYRGIDDLTTSNIAGSGLLINTIDSDDYIKYDQNNTNIVYNG